MANIPIKIEWELRDAHSFTEIGISDASNSFGSVRSRVALLGNAN